MIPEALDLLHGISVESENIRRKVGMGIEPEIVEDHDSVLVAGFIELIVCGGSNPIADHIEVHFLVEFHLQVIFIFPTPEQPLAHTPVPTFAIDFLSIARNLEHSLCKIVGIFLYPEFHGL